LKAIVVVEKSKTKLALPFRKYHLAIPATSAECSFSSANLTASVLQSRLGGQHVEVLNVLHFNKNVIGL